MRLCYTGSPTDTSFYDWPQLKFDASGKVPALIQQHIPQEETSTYQYGRMRLGAGAPLSPEIVLNGFEVYQPLLAITNNTSSNSTANRNNLRKKEYSSKEGDKAAGDTMELTSPMEASNNLNGEKISKCTTGQQIQTFETSFV